MNILKPVTVYTSQNQTDHLLVQSVLEEQGIKFFIKNESLQNLFGVGQFGIGYNQITGPMEIQVQGQDVDRAKTVIKDVLGKEHLKSNLSYSSTEEIESKILKQYNFYLNAAVIIGLVLPPFNLYHLLKAFNMKYNLTLDLKGGYKLLLASLLSLFGFFLWFKIIL